MSSELKNKKVAVLGLGVEGLSTVNYLLKHSAAVSVLDEKAFLNVEVIDELTKQGVALHFGNDVFRNLDKYDLVFRSPGIPFLRMEIQEALKKGVVITSQTKYFFDHCPGVIIGITGTKGKGTTSTLLYEMLINDKKNAYLGGNIGMPPLNFLDIINDQSLVVLELSSFQLQDLTKSPHIGVVLMITSEHLDHHKNIEEYVNAKRNIIAHQSPSDIAIINVDYLASRESDMVTSGQVFQVSREATVGYGAWLKDDEIWIRQKDKEFSLMHSNDVLLPGKHNLENVMSASLAALQVGVSIGTLVSTIKNFKGLKHRLELVRDVNGIRFYDDSFATAPDSTIAAIDSFESPEIVILGGSSKDADFQLLGYTISHKSNIKAIIGIGKEWPRIKETIRAPKSSMLFVENATNMEQIVQAANKIAEPGDVVLLSPACASFDMFKNYKDRGEQFSNEVNKL